MAVSIDKFKQFVEFVSNKVQVGNSVTITQFNELANRAQMQLFEKDRQIFLTNQETSDYLELFLKSIVVSVPPSGNVPYPADFQHTASMRAYYYRPDGKSVEVPVDPVKNRDWGQIYASQLNPGTKRFPKYTEFRKEYRVLPKDIGIIMIDYFKTPIPPVWNYTVASGRPVYDPTGSVDFEWDEFAFNNVAAMYLSLIGINLKDGDLLSFSEMYKKETSSPL